MISIKQREIKQTTQGEKKLTCERILWEVQGNREQMENHDEKTIKQKEETKTMKWEMWTMKEGNCPLATSLTPLSHCYSVLLDFLSTASLASLCSAANFDFDNTGAVLSSKLEICLFNDFKLRWDSGRIRDFAFS